MQILTYTAVRCFIRTAYCRHAMEQLNSTANSTFMRVFAVGVWSTNKDCPNKSKMSADTLPSERSVYVQSPHTAVEQEAEQTKKNLSMAKHTKNVKIFELMWILLNLKYTNCVIFPLIITFLLLSYLCSSFFSIDNCFLSYIKIPLGIRHVGVRIFQQLFIIRFGFGFSLYTTIVTFVLE